MGTNPISREILAQLAKGVLRQKIPALQEALAGRFGPHHTLMVGEILAHIDYPSISGRWELVSALDGAPVDPRHRFRLLEWRPRWTAMDPAFF